MSELYQKLRIDASASQADVRRAYHKMALLYHPDRNLGDEFAEAEFKNIVSAFEILGDPKTRALYDQGRIDDLGRPCLRRPIDRTCETSSSGDDARGSDGFRDSVRASDKETASGRRAGRAYWDDIGSAGPIREKQYLMTIDFIEACVGTVKHVRLPNKAQFKINIPAGVKTDQRLRVKSPGENGKPFVVKIRVEPHQLFTRDGNDIILDVPITPYECYFGVELDVPTIHGPAKVTIPANTKEGDEVHMDQMGLRAVDKPAGDQIVCVRVALPNVWPEQVKTAMADWRRKAPYNPRGKIMRLLAG